ncbi:hypothetical protein K440DRAFT_661356 [Wilcoxina mikolae CBS 423.85]|nr:hypothetical protein K440DRAFT_661356 [Wilcoxina mikolae CBS 423.85]
MGSHHSVLVPFDEDKSGDQRNKLTKPRTYSNATVTCLPSLSSGSRLTLLGSSKILSSKENVARHGGVSGVERLSSANVHSNLNDFNPTSENPCDRNPIARVSEGNASSLQTVTNLPLRRRSTLLAAPPATISRKSTKTERHPTRVVKIESTAASSVAPDADSCRQLYITRSDYSLIKRGSLRVTNASPTPSSGPAPALLTPNIDGVPEYLATRPDRAYEASHPTSEVTCSCLNSRGSPFDCPESPALGCLCIHDDSNRPLPGVPALLVPRHEHGTEQSMPRSRITMSPKNIFDDIARRQQAYIAAVGNAQRIVSQHPMNITTHSGYSSTESMTSWQTSESGFTAEITTTSMATFGAVNNAINNSNIYPDRCPTVIALEGGNYGPTAQTALDEDLSSFGEAGKIPKVLSNKLPEEEHTVVSIPRTPSSSHRMSDSSLSAEILDKITGQVYYQRFSRRRSQLEDVKNLVPVKISRYLDQPKIASEKATLEISTDFIYARIHLRPIRTTTFLELP